MQMNEMDERFGFDAPQSQPLEESVGWAGRNGFRYIDFQADLPPNDLASFDRARVRRVRDLCQRHGVALGIHPSSAVNNAEYVPIMAEAASDYLAANLELAERLGCGWIIGHGGYHFGDLGRRRAAAIERLRRLADLAERKNLTVFFENHNREPEHAECTTCRTPSRRPAGSSTPFARPASSGRSTWRTATWCRKGGAAFSTSSEPTTSARCA